MPKTAIARFCENLTTIKLNWLNLLLGLNQPMMQKSVPLKLRLVVNACRRGKVIICLDFSAKYTSK